MKTTIETVTISKNEYDELRAKADENKGLEAAVAELSAKVEWLMEQFRLAQHRRFGVSSEKSGYDGQLTLFNEAEVASDILVPEPELVEIERHFRKRKNMVNDKLPEDLPVEIVEHVLPESEQICPECDGQLHNMGRETIRRELKLIPAKAVIIEHIRNVYACRQCEKDGWSDASRPARPCSLECGVPIIKAPVCEPVIKGGFASPEAVAHIAVQKFVMGVPLYRQAHIGDRRERPPGQNAKRSRGSRNGIGKALCFQGKPCQTG